MLTIVKRACVRYQCAIARRAPVYKRGLGSPEGSDYNFKLCHKTCTQLAILSTEILSLLALTMAAKTIKVRPIQTI